MLKQSGQGEYFTKLAERYLPTLPDLIVEKNKIFHNGHQLWVKKYMKIKEVILLFTTGCIQSYWAQMLMAIYSYITLRKSLILVARLVDFL